MQDVDRIKAYLTVSLKEIGNESPTTVKTAVNATADALTPQGETATTEHPLVELKKLHSAADLAKSEILEKDMDQFDEFGILKHAETLPRSKHSAKINTEQESDSTLPLKPSFQGKAALIHSQGKRNSEIINSRSNLSGVREISSHPSLRRQRRDYHYPTSTIDLEKRCGSLPRDAISTKTSSLSRDTITYKTNSLPRNNLGSMQSSLQEKPIFVIYPKREIKSVSQASLNHSWNAGARRSSKGNVNRQVETTAPPERSLLKLVDVNRISTSADHSRRSATVDSRRVSLAAEEEAAAKAPSSYNPDINQSNHSSTRLAHRLSIGVNTPSPLPITPLRIDTSPGIDPNALQSLSNESPPYDHQFNNNRAYYEYLMLQQRHASINFIHKIDSIELGYSMQDSKAKFVGPFLLGEVIGKGSFGKVKEGLCSETLQRVAVKIISKKRLRKVANGVKNVIQEIKLLRRLKHRNIIKLIDVFCKVEDELTGNIGVFNWFTTIEDEPILWVQDDNTEMECNVKILKWYIVFEYCPCSLQTIIDQETKIDLARSHWFFKQMAEGIAYLHGQSVIHRDIKPGNMLITADGTIKISDFGIAEQFNIYDGSEMMSTEFAGTHQFIPPEIAEGATSFTGRKVDIWALGVTLYNMVTGRLPFALEDDGNLLALYENIQKGDFATPPDIDSLCEHLIRGMLHRASHQRYSINDILNHPWTRGYYINVPMTWVSFVNEESALHDNETSSICYKIPCETTMIKTLKNLHLTEVEEKLKRQGLLENKLYEQDGCTSSATSKIPPRKASVRSWFKEFLIERKTVKGKH